MATKSDKLLEMRQEQCMTHSNTQVSQTRNRATRTTGFYMGSSHTCAFASQAVEWVLSAMAEMTRLRLSRDHQRDRAGSSRADSNNNVHKNSSSHIGARP